MAVLEAPQFSLLKIFPSFFSVSVLFCTTSFLRSRPVAQAQHAQRPRCRAVSSGAGCGWSAALALVCATVPRRQKQPPHQPGRPPGRGQSGARGTARMRHGPARARTRSASSRELSTWRTWFTSVAREAAPTRTSAKWRRAGAGDFYACTCLTRWQLTARREQPRVQPRRHARSATQQAGCARRNTTRSGHDNRDGRVTAATSWTNC